MSFMKESTISSKNYEKPMIDQDGYEDDAYAYDNADCPKGPHGRTGRGTRVARV